MLPPDNPAPLPGKEKDNEVLESDADSTKETTRARYQSIFLILIFLMSSENDEEERLLSALESIDREEKEVVKRKTKKTKKRKTSKVQTKRISSKDASRTTSNKGGAIPTRGDCKASD
jgi:hypothetical protein